MAERSKPKKNVAKRGKSSWRKHSDISDVEKYLENERIEKHFGDPQNKPDDQLFVVETGKDIVAKALIRRKKVLKPIKCFRYLEPDPLSRPAITKRRIPVQRGKKTAAKLEKREGRFLDGIFEKKSKAEKLKIPKSNEDSFACDLWSTEDKSKDENENDEFQKPLIEYYLKQLKQKLPRRPVRRDKKPTDIPAVEFIHSGGSYNPNFTDYYAYMAHANKIEKKKFQNKKRLAQQLRNPCITEKELQEALDEEMKSGLFDEESEEESAEEDSVEGIKNNSVDREKRRTRQKRRRQLVAKLLEKQAKEQKKLKHREYQIFKVKKINREIAAQEKLTEERIKRRKKAKKLLRFKTQKFGVNKYTPPSIPVLLTTELPGSLRRLKPQGNMLEDRIKSLRKRNLIDAEVKVRQPRRPRMKRYEPWPIKRITL